MSFSRTPKNKNYPFTQISNSLVNDRHLSYQAVGLLSYLLSKPDYWYINTNDLVNSHSNGYSSVRSIISELVLHGYLFKHRLRYPDGRYSSYFYHVSESPVKTNTSPYVDFPHVDKPLLENPPVDNRNLAINKIKLRLSKTSTSSTKVVQPTTQNRDASSFKNKKEKCIQLMQSLNMINCNSIINKYGLDTVFKRAIWFQECSFKPRNPTGFLVTAIKEDWDFGSPVSSGPKLLVQEQTCSSCNRCFQYLDYEPTRNICSKCELNIK